MKITFPVRDKNGKNYTSLEEVMSLINSEAHGSWLMGANGLWHGGIHISDVTHPYSALSEEVLKKNTAVPLQFVADGTIVAYRINKTYPAAPYCGKELRFSSSFVLVKSILQPDLEKQNSWLEFYTLYMHLAAVTDYPSLPCYKVAPGRKGVPLRIFTKDQFGLPEGEEDKGGNGIYTVPSKATGRRGVLTVSEGDRLVLSRKGQFYITEKKGKQLHTFGLVQQVKNGKASKKQYWVTMNPKVLIPDGELAELMPAWMQSPVAEGTFDKIVNTDGQSLWKVSAGTTVGFMGVNEIPNTGNQLVMQERFLHLELLSNDRRMPDFISNPAGVDNARKFIRTISGRTIYLRTGDAGSQVFEASNVKVNISTLLSRDSTTPFKDASGKRWFKVCESGWVSQSDIEEIEQFDLISQGFIPMEENSANDVTKSEKDKWIPEAFGHIARAASDAEKMQYGRVPEYYRKLVEKIDENKDGQISPDEIRRALTVRDPLVQNVVSRLIVKHHSEWFGGRSTGRWDDFFRASDKLENKYNEKYLSELEWMSQVEPFKKGEPIWHFHPVMFVDSLRNRYAYSVDMIQQVLGHEKAWFTGASGGKKFANRFKDNYSSVYEYDKYKFVSLLNNITATYGIESPYQKAHFLSQCLHESSHLDTTLEFGNGKNYDPGVHTNAVSMENTSIGDGPLYRGRGLIQLTWKKNYRLFSEYSGVNVVDNPDLVANNMEETIKASAWFWRYSGGIFKKYDANGDINVLIDNEENNVALVTLAVNGGSNGLAERQSYFDAIKKYWKLK